MPEAKSIIAVAMAYLTERGHKLSRSHPTRGLHGQITVYAYGQDYHKVMQERLEKLRARIEEHLQRPVRGRVAVDTSPLVDRRVAERAGIGWIGKNCMFYSPTHGSFVFLGTLLVDVEIEPAKEEFSDRCGTCERCLVACPTHALIAPGVIDAKRCLSYITQMKGIIPEEFRIPMGRRVWGCDTCQWACPENKDIAYAEHEEYLPHGELEYPELIEILKLSNREFMRRYGHTAAAWRGLRTWQRNALIALGNSRNQDAVDHIVPFLSHPRSELRASAAWALRRIGDERGRQAVAEALEQESDPEVIREMMWSRDSYRSEDSGRSEEEASES
jgi:epoxyqueuosine reductase